MAMTRMVDSTMSNHDLALCFEDIFQRLLAREKLDAHAKNLSTCLEYIATRLLGDYPSRKGHYFDGAVGLAATVKSDRQVDFQGEMWVGGNHDQWTEPLLATVTDKRIAKEGIWIVLQVGTDRAEGEVTSICGGTRA